MRVGIGYSDNPDSALAGKLAVQEAQEKAGRENVCDVVLLFATARHDEDILRKAVAAETGNTERIYGGGAAGIITNDKFGYAGDQVGVACIWLEGAEWNVIDDDGLAQGEEEAGIRLGKKLAEQGVQPDSSVMMFYDALDYTSGDLRLVMATWLLEGLEKGLGFLPDLVGAGLQGDHVCSPVKQFVGDTMTEHDVMAMTFSDDIRIDSTIMHGCRPASAYYTVTKAEGPVILEINNEPAIPFIDRVLESTISPEEYPFFLLFGINRGERWGEYDENNYASRLCLGIDKERNGIVMFEPDMVPGTEFQLMFRSFDLEYMRPKIEELFDRLGEREPVFAMYIDCAGRCAGYGGVDLEDAVVLQDVIAGRVPLLGLYTGVEIGSIQGRPRGLDWTGVFCLFSRGEQGAGAQNKQQASEASLQEKCTGEASGADDENISLEALQRLCEQNAAKVLKLDTDSIAIRHELEQKRRGFALLAELSVSIRQTTEYLSILDIVTRRINGALNMQKTVVLSAREAKKTFAISVLQGYTAEEKADLLGKQVSVSDSFLDHSKSVLVTAADEPNRFSELRNLLGLPYFISTPVVVRDEVVALLITGRTAEQTPFLSRLSEGDAETIRAISALLSTVLVYEQLAVADKKAQADVLTGLFNREAFEQRVNESLFDGASAGQMSAFVMIDFDNFKDVNDTYGHLQGDIALKTLANALMNNFRSTDVVARLGGDEFAVFCPSIGKVEQVSKVVDRLMSTWRETTFTTDDGTQFSETLSIGIAIAPRDGETYRELYQKADIALYKSKQSGRDRCTIYDM